MNDLEEYVDLEILSLFAKGAGVGIEGLGEILEENGELVKERYRSKTYSEALALIKRSKEHRHPFTEVYHVISDAGVVYLNDVKKEVRKGDVLPIPSGTWHYAENVALVVACTP